MSFLVFLPLAVSLGIYLIPVCLLRRRAYAQTQDYFVSSPPAPPGVIQNASIAYALRMATFGPLFAWGASGDFWPAIINSVFFALGLYLVCRLRRPLLEFLANALGRDQSITVHEFIARQHGNDPRVRLLASALTIFAIAGLASAEALGVATLLKPVLPTAATIAGVVMLSVLYTIISGNSGVMRSAQSQLGILYLGLFATTALLLYLVISALKPMPPPATFALIVAAACCAILLSYRRARYVDTSPIRKINRSDTDDIERPPLSARLFRRYENILNVCICTLAAVVIVIALMGLYAGGFDGTAALLTGTRMSGMGLLAVLLLPLFHPLVDITNWQRMAAIVKDVEPSGRNATFGRIFKIYAGESALVSLFLCMFGAIAVVLMPTPGDADVMQAFMQQLTSQQNPVASAAVSLLLMGVFAIALSTMSSLLSASFCTIRYDILPAFWPESAKTPAAARAVRRSIVAGGGLCLVILAASCLADAYLPISFASSEFLALLCAFYCAQLAFVPLVLGPIIGRTSAGFRSVSPAWALLIMSLSAAIGIGAVIVSFATGNDPWAAVPACLGTGLVLFALARWWPAPTHRAA